VEISLYTSIYARYDELRAPRLIEDGIEYRCFTDSYKKDYWPWKVIHQYPDEMTPVRCARKRKILSHKYIDTEYSIWVDSNLELLVNPTKLCQEYLVKTDIAMFGHPHRKNIYEEARECLRPVAIRDKPIIINTQVRRYRKEGFDLDLLMSTGVLLRRHTEEVKEFNELWWEEVRKGSHRDQLSFPYVVWKTGMKIMRIPGNIFNCPLVWYRHSHVNRPNHPQFL